MASLVVEPEEPVLMALPPPKTLNLDVEIPPGLRILPEPPAWVESALVDKSTTAADMLDNMIVYRWPARLGGWLVGKVTEINNDRTEMVDGAVGNFKVYYEADQETATHHLTLSRYAKSTRAVNDSWALLG